MKKIIIFLTCIFLVVGCACSNDKGLSTNVLKDIDELVDKEAVEEKNKDKYKDALKRQYRDLMYTIENEDYDGDNAKVTVKITVYDFYKAQKNSNDYLNSHKDEFLTDGVYDAAKYIEYKLGQLNK